MIDASWISHPTPEGGSYDYHSCLENVEEKERYGFNLTLYAGVDEDSEEELPFANKEEQKSFIEFQQEILAALQEVTEVLAYGRFWHQGLCQMEFRVKAPDLANEKLQEIISSEQHRYPFEYQMFPDPCWTIPDSYLSGSIVDDVEENAGAIDLTEDEVADSPGLEALHAGEFKKAAELLSEEVAGEAAEDSERWVMLADAYYNLEDFEQLENTVSIALEKFPSNGGLYRALASAQIRGGQLETAEATCRKGIAVDVARASLHHNLACALALQGKHDEALDSIETCVQIEPFRRIDISQDTDFDALKEHPRYKELTDPSEMGMVVGSRHTENPHARVLLIAVQGRIEPVERGEAVEEPLQELLSAASAGTVLGGAIKMGFGVIDDETYLEVGTDEMERAIEVARDFLSEIELTDAMLYPDSEVSQPRDPSQGLPIKE